MTAVISTTRAQLPKGFDLSGNLNNGTLASGRAVLLAGADYIDCGSPAASQFGTGVDFSVSYWAKTSTTSGEIYVFPRRDDNTGTSYDGWRFGFNDGKPRYNLQSDAGSNPSKEVTSSQVTADGDWHFYAFTIDRDGNWVNYIDGAVDATVDGSAHARGNISPSSRNMGIGAAYIGGTEAQFFVGAVSSVKLYKSTILTAAQVLEQYQNPEQMLPTGLVAADLDFFYPLCDYQNDTGDSLNGLYFMDLGAGKANGLATGCGMDLAEKPPCPQLGLMPSTSRRYTVDDSYVSIGADSDINGLFSSGGTLAFWAQAMSIGHEVVAYLVYTGTGGYTVYLQNDSSGTAKILFKTYHSTTSGEWITNGQVITYGTWQHIVFAYNASSVSNDPVIYINGSATAITEQQTPAGTTPADSAAKIIGNNDTPNH